MKYTIGKIREQSQWMETAAEWFSRKWGIPREAYLESMEQCLGGVDPVPQWYIATERGAIIAGIGVIENDFHERTDLAPNVCALYVEEAYRRRGIAGELLAFVRRDMREMGIPTLYLVTEHTSFYERYGWEFLCMVQGDEGKMRMYVCHSGEDR